MSVYSRSGLHIKYPRYTKKEDARCKLSDEDIQELRELRKNGYLIREIAELFNVSSSTIRYNLNDETKKYIIEKAKESRYRNFDRVKNAEIRKKTKKKKKLLSKEFRIYLHKKRNEARKRMREKLINLNKIK